MGVDCFLVTKNGIFNLDRWSTFSNEFESDEVYTVAEALAKISILKRREYIGTDQLDYCKYWIEVVEHELMNCLPIDKMIIIDGNTLFEVQYDYSNRDSLSDEEVIKQLLDIPDIGNKAKENQQ